jgi:hypothetical protein
VRVDTGHSKVVHRSLPVDDMLAVADRFEELLGTADEVPLCIGALSDGRSIDAPDLSGLRADLAGVADEDVTHLSIGIGSPTTTQIWLSRDPEPSSDSGVATRLRVIGEDEGSAQSVFSEVERALDERLRAVEEAERRAAAERERLLAEARRQAAERAAREEAARKAAAPKDEGRAKTRRPPQTWELWAVGVAAAVAAIAVLIGVGLLIH